MFNLFSGKPQPIKRAAAMHGNPCKTPVVKTEKTENRLLVTVELCRPGWQQLLGAEQMAQRTFALDEYGQEVYGYCNGKTSVKHMAKKFAKRHHISIPEAEISVATFLRTLMQKGLIGVEIDEAAFSKTDGD